MYEVLPTEPLHDIKEHISNVVTKIVAHLPAFFGCACPYPAPYYLLQVNKHRATRTPLQHIFQHLYSNIK